MAFDEPRAEMLHLRAQSRKSAEKRSAIVRAATNVINAKSYALATMSDIAAALQLRDATLYYYFPSKQALAYACHRRSLETCERLLADADASDLCGAEKLRHFLRAMLEDADCHGAQLYFGDYSYLAPDQRAEIAAWAARLTGIIENFLEAGIADGSVVRCETRLVVQLLLGMLIWLVKWVPNIKGITVDRLMTAIDAASLQGLEANGAAAAGGENFSRSSAETRRIAR